MAYSFFEDIIKYIKKSDPWQGSLSVAWGTSTSGEKICEVKRLPLKVAGRSVDSVMYRGPQLPCWLWVFTGQHQQPKGQPATEGQDSSTSRDLVCWDLLLCAVSLHQGVVLVNSSFISREGHASTKFQVNKGICRERMETAKTKISLGSCEVSDLERTESWVFPGGLLTRPSSPSQPVAMVLN